MKTFQKWIFGFAVCGLLVSTGPWSRAEEDLNKRASWAPALADQTKVQFDTWLATQKPNEATVAKINALWPKEEVAASGPELLERLCESIALANKDAVEIVALSRTKSDAHPQLKFAILDDEKTAPLVRNNLRLLVGRWLAQNDLYDEALEQIGKLQPNDVVDPASLLFYQSIAHHRLLEKEQFQKAITKLMENEKSIPRRYQILAKLMEADIKPLKVDSLDEVSRLMDDIRRRLDFGRAGTKVRKEEDDVIAKLDKMIEKMEEDLKKQQQQASGSGQGSGQSQSSTPKQQSTPGGVKGPGDVDPKNIGSQQGWGNLPPKKRQEALQNISKDLPAHFRETIEEYFRKLANDAGKR